MLAIIKGKLRQVRWPKLLVRTVVWLGAKIALTCLGLDDLADYSEFIFQDRSGVPATEISISLTTSV